MCANGVTPEQMNGFHKVNCRLTETCHYLRIPISLKMGQRFIRRPTYVTSRVSTLIFIGKRKVS